MTELKSIRETPGVIKAIQWLLSDEVSTPQQLIKKAVKANLVYDEVGEHWKANTQTLEQMFSKRSAEFPNEIGEQAEIIYGLGELSARSHAQLFETLIHLLTNKSTNQNIETFLDYTVCHRKQLNEPSTKEIISISAVFKIAFLDWNSINYAVQHLLYTQNRFNRPYYGFAFATRLALYLAPEKLVEWVEKHKECNFLANIFGCILEEVQWGNNRSFADAFIKGNNIFLKAMGCAILVTRGWDNEDEEISIDDRIKRFKRLGLTQSDAIWISLFIFKDTMHEYHRLKGKIDDKKREYRVLKQNNPNLNKRNEYGEYQFQNLKDQLLEKQSKLKALETYIETSLENIAKHWPQNGLTVGQLIYTEKSFVTPLTIRNRLAEKLSHKNNIKWFLNKNLLDTIEYLISDNSEWQKEYFYYDRHRDDDRLMSTAKSAVLHFTNNSNQLRNFIRDHFAKFTVQANNLIEEPFVAVRKGAVWMSATERLAAVHLFVLFILEATPEDKKVDIQTFVYQHLPHHVTKLLFLSGDRWSDRGMYIRDQLIQTFIWFSKRDDSLDKTISEWTSNVGLSRYARTFAIWSNYKYISSNKKESLQLFEESCHLPMGDTYNERRLNQMINLFDIAICELVDNNDEDLAIQLVTIWTNNLSNWPENIRTEWQCHASRIKRAMFGDSEERNLFRNDARFEKTYCSSWLNEKYS